MDAVAALMGIGAIKSVQRGTVAAAGYVTINSVSTKAIVLSNSKGSGGYVAARGDITLNATSDWYDSSAPPDRAHTSGSSAGGWPPFTGSIIGGSTDLIVRVYSAKYYSATQIYCDGPCEWQVIDPY